MALIDALLLDPTPFNVWIAYRTGGIKGCGTGTDPYDGSMRSGVTLTASIATGHGTRGVSIVRTDPFMKRFFLIAVLATFDITASAAPTASNIWAPEAGLTNMDGNSSLAPFETAGRFQQVYNASAFAPLEQAGGGWLNAIVFRVDASVGHGFDAILTNSQLNISTTTRAADGLSAVFADNVGTDDMRVLGPAAMFLSGVGGGGITTFSVLFDVPDNTFFYNPANGNLLLDFRIFTGIGPIGPPQGVAILDAFDVVGDSVSSLYASGSANAVMGQLSSLGLATTLTFTPVPEPPTWALITLAIVVSAVWWYRKKLNKEVPRGSD